MSRISDGAKAKKFSLVKQTDNFSFLWPLVISSNQAVVSLGSGAEERGNNFTSGQHRKKKTWKKALQNSMIVQGTKCSMQIEASSPILTIPSQKTKQMQSHRILQHLIEISGHLEDAFSLGTTWFLASNSMYRQKAHAPFLSNT